MNLWFGTWKGYKFKMHPYFSPFSLSFLQIKYASLTLSHFCGGYIIIKSDNLFMEAKHHFANKQMFYCCYSSLSHDKQIQSVGDKIVPYMQTSSDISHQSTMRSYSSIIILISCLVTLIESHEENLPMSKQPSIYLFISNCT